ncbi:MAG: hypothetical protein NTX79_02180 [Candidatus Micrarchaeota archaeon]|nr:hypothetical protein [Candidatus Micrarchaeota archaeon]
MFSISMRRLYVLFALSLIASSVFAADDYNPGIRAYCEKLLGVNAAANATDGAANGTQVRLVVVNATFGASHNDTLAKLLAANASIAKMRNAGLPSQNAMDTYMLAKQWFGGQEAIELSGGRPNYGFALQKITEINDLEQGTYQVNDDLKALAERISTADSGANLTSTKALVADAAQEFRDGRIDKAKALIIQAYDEVTNAEFQAVHSRTIGESARRTIENFLADNWKTIVNLAAAALILFFLFQKQIRKALVSARLKSLIRERAVIESMLKSLQKEYFEKKSVTELTYRVKTKKYGDIIRNINRQLPLLKEQLRRI